MLNQQIYTPSDGLKIILRAAKEYNTNINNRDFVFLAKESKNIVAYVTTFKPDNFLHFVGVKTKLKPRDFFVAALNNKLTIRDFSFKNNELTSMKLDVIMDAMNIHKTANNIGWFDNQSISINADLGAGNHKYCITFKAIKGNKITPVSVFKGDIRKKTNPTNPIIGIVSKDRNKVLYDIITYKSKNIDIENLHFPKEILKMIAPEAIKQLNPSLYERTVSNNKNMQKNENHNTPTTLSTENKIIENIVFDELIGQEALSHSKEKAKSEAAATFERKPKSFDDMLRSARERAVAREQSLQPTTPDKSKDKDKDSPSLDNN